MFCSKDKQIFKKANLVRTVMKMPLLQLHLLEDYSSNVI